jgi:hypothetical protein
MRLLRRLLGLLPLLAPVAACETYDPPPEATLVQPEQGFWTDASPIELVFSEAIDPATLELAVWPSDLDVEGQFRPGVVPLISGCTLTSSPCARGLEVTLNDARDRLTLTQKDAFADVEGRPLVLILSAGLADPAGRVRRVETRFDFQINPRCGNEPIDLELASGVLTMAANLQVLPIWLYMYLDLAVDPATGRATVVGTFARLKEGELAGNNYAPSAFQAELGPSGWAVTFSGCVVRQPDGGLFFQSEPFDVNILALGAIPITLTDFTVQGTLVEGGGEGGRDGGSGTLSTSGGSFGEPPTPIDPITTAWNGLGLGPDEIPEGLPRVCVADPCAGMDAAGGDCQLPTPWEPGEVCPAGVTP